MDKKATSTGASRGQHNYELKSDAVDALADADTQEAPEYSEEELNQYRSKHRFHLAEPVKILLIKVWFAGAVCFFILWGLGTYVASTIDMLFILGVVLGIVTDLLTNNVIRFIEKTPGENDAWLMFPKKGMVSFFLNMVMGIVILIGVFLLYTGINTAITTITQNPDTVPLGVEPILFGVFCVAFEMLFVGLRNLLKTILSDARQAAAHEKKGQAKNE